MECLLHCGIYKDRLRILFIETIPKETMRDREVLSLYSAKFSDIGKMIILLLGGRGRYGTLLFSLGFLL